MTITFRHYDPVDFELVSDFFIANYQPGNRDGNWLQPAWEYMHSHPYLDESSLGKIAIWEDSGVIVGVAHYESRLGEAFFQVHLDYGYLKPAMLDYAESHLYEDTADGDRLLQVAVNDFDQELEDMVISRGYQMVNHGTRSISHLTVPRSFETGILPEGFVVKSLADENNLRKIHRVLWRGFEHEGEPPEEGIADRKKMQSGPNFRKDLTIVVESPAGDFVSFCGLWYEPVNRYAYVEPLATDPDYRRMGLARAAVWEGVRRCLELGAKEVFVGSDQEFCKAIGFSTLFKSNCWVREYRKENADDAD